MKLITSPIDTVIVAGSKVLLPPGPTVTVCKTPERNRKEQVEEVEEIDEEVKQ